MSASFLHILLLLYRLIVVRKQDMTEVPLLNYNEVSLSWCTTDASTYVIICISWKAVRSIGLFYFALHDVVAHIVHISFLILSNLDTPFCVTEFYLSFVHALCVCAPFFSSRANKLLIYLIDSDV